LGGGDVGHTQMIASEEIYFFISKGYFMPLGYVSLSLYRQNYPMV
jgi:hypothetical protein